MASDFTSHALLFFHNTDFLIRKHMYIGRCMLEIITAFISWINIQFPDTHARARTHIYMHASVYWPIILLYKIVCKYVYCILVK